MKNGKLQILTVILVAVLLAAMVPFAMASEEHEHKYGNWKVVKEPDCTNPGYKRNYCTHSGCESFSEEVSMPALNHNYTSRTSPDATCKTEGTMIYTCTRCGDSYTETIPKKAHTYGEWYPKPGDEATCQKSGKLVRNCSSCGDPDPNERVAPQLPHQFSWKETKQPDCTNDGEREGICVLCKTEKKTETIRNYGGKNQPKGHDLSAWSEKTKGDCKTEIQRSRTCSKCGRVEVEKFGKGKHVVKTSKSKDGKNTYAWFLKTKPSMQGPGRAVQYCSVCGKVIKSKEIKFEGGRYNIPVTGFGPRAANVNGSLSGSNDRLIPVDFTNTEPQMFGLITNDGVLVGQIHLRVMGDTVSVNYTMNDMETVVNQAVFFLYSDATSLTAADLTDLTRAHQFGETIPLNGQTFGVLAARLVVNYNGENAANRPFSESGLYLDGVTNNATILQEMTANLLGQ